jgi:hypothetical protein
MYMYTLICGMARRGFSRLVGENLCVHYVSKLTKIDISPIVYC